MCRLLFMSHIIQTIIMTFAPIPYNIITQQQFCQYSPTMSCVIVLKRRKRKPSLDLAGELYRPFFLHTHLCIILYGEKWVFSLQFKGNKPY